MKILRKWEVFKTIIGANEDFNKGIEIGINLFLPEDLYSILRESNGQKKDTSPIFGEFVRGVLGTQNIYYRFLSLQEILETINEMKNVDKIESINLIPFAKYSIVFNGEINTHIFSIDKNSRIIYKIYFFYWEKFIRHKEFRSEKITENLEEFIDNQILWYKEGYFKRPRLY
ncbi:SMI1/KNR4 family protein [Capnocytophaga bilenii]